MKYLLKLGKEISYALRHAPEEYGLTMDNEGWVSIDQLITSLNKKNNWGIDIDDIFEIVVTSEKKRYEINKDRIRAYYGHSIQMKIKKVKQIPHEILYHGTAQKFVKSILKKGLLSQNRQYVHLSLDIETATKVGKRRGNEPVILIIDAIGAYRSGINFYHGNENVWLSDEIPAEFISIYTQ